MQVNIALLTVTDTRTLDTDKSGAILVKKINEQNHKLIDRKIVKDEINEIKKIDLRKRIESLEDKVSINLDEKLYSELLSLKNQLKGR